MENKNYDDIKKLIEVIEKINKKEIEESSDLVDDIIKYKYEDEQIISQVFDKILSIGFATEEDIKDAYYKLLNYVKKFNKELSKDYEEIFIEQFKEKNDNKKIDIHK